MAAVDDYLAQFDGEQLEILSEVRAALLRAVPGAEEKVRYGMPAVMLGGRYAIHFAGWKKHVGIYPVAPLSEPLESEIAPFRAAKDALNFDWAKPVPFDLIERVAAELNAQHA